MVQLYTCLVSTTQTPFKGALNSLYDNPSLQKQPHADYTVRFHIYIYIHILYNTILRTTRLLETATYYILFFYSTRYIPSEDSCCPRTLDTPNYRNRSPFILYSSLLDSILVDSTILCHTKPYHILLQYAMLCYAMLCYAMLCYAMLCYAVLCYANATPYHSLV